MLNGPDSLSASRRRRIEPSGFLDVARVCMLLVLGIACNWPRTLAGQAATLRGRVSNATTRRPIVDAVLVLTPHDFSVRTDTSGQFNLRGLPFGEYTLLVRAVGYIPASARVPLSARAALDLDVDLEPLAPLLDSVIKQEDPDVPRNFAMREFEARRIAGFGRFITREELLRGRGRSLDAILRARVPGVRLLDFEGKIVAASGRDISRRRPCFLNVIVEGALRYTLNANMPLFDLRSLEASMIAGIEYYTVASLPAEFNLRGQAPCGTLVIWLQN
ncbi:MAG: carboxypeptidase-like regulatory domain-containing protein [Gemmatimonadaceae bacterium]|jgi:hypothetical protein|nr:carboxypeptidase-like regulatory domain-containing protein [Gemmatimonadaceae bacterium]